ncbi:hypothetical protein ABKN59_007383 [Abortiporus biennis]
MSLYSLVQDTQLTAIDCHFGKHSSNRFDIGGLTTERIPRLFRTCSTTIARARKNLKYLFSSNTCNLKIPGVTMTQLMTKPWNTRRKVWCFVITRLERSVLCILGFNPNSGPRSFKPKISNSLLASVQRVRKTPRAKVAKAAQCRHLWECTNNIHSYCIIDFAKPLKYSMPRCSSSMTVLQLSISYCLSITTIHKYCLRRHDPSRQILIADLFLPAPLHMSRSTPREIDTKNGEHREQEHNRIYWNLLFDYIGQLFYHPGPMLSFKTSWRMTLLEQ